VAVGVGWKGWICAYCAVIKLCGWDLAGETLPQSLLAVRT
jgi:hypothetical protein